MQFNSKKFKSVDLTPTILSQQIDDYRQGDIYGYFLVDDMLVPKTLVDRIYSRLCEITFDYGYVQSIQELLGDEFWWSLDDDEQSVAGACVLIVIENDYSVPVLKEFEIRH